MTNLKVLSMAAALALVLPVALTGTSYAQHAGGINSGGGGVRAGGGGGFRGGGGAMGGGAAINRGGGGYRGPVAGGGAVYAGPRNGPTINGGVAGPRYSGGNWGGQYRHRQGGFWPGVALGVGVGSYAYYGGNYDPYYYNSYGYYDDGYYDDGSTVAVVPGGDDPASCAQRYRSYDPASGTYLGYDGQRHPCP